eukprot:CAMPEP_0119118500 /NCGR_PEP_ID=MMETSP1310-20130426/354_1 /TAXON_ID=464262 /ORGANISM="Genus nov. species nov., Strain RCC2339" /LENGTH=293 /DNA_ID=CAMNT_0007107869 /DNA_START=61 /DNA_END=942 /DNA_ORIENTATION=+
MGFVKVIKNKPYFKRYQVKYRRRREGRTDYYARKRLVTQDKNKYSSPKYRLVVRITNKDVICQLVYAQLSGDRVICSAYAHQLAKYGVSCGLKNYAAAYATGLLLARRHLKNLGLDDKYTGAESVSGEDYNVEPIDGPRPFKALLDVGLARTTTGAKVFAALKGAADGGLNVPHSASRFVGFDAESDSLDTQVLEDHLFGRHVSNYMRLLQEKNDGSYEKVFSQYLKAGVGPDDVEGMWSKAHAGIREDPTHAKKAAKENPDMAHKKFKQHRRSYEQRKNRVKQRKAHAAKKQ